MGLTAGKLKPWGIVRAAAFNNSQKRSFPFTENEAAWEDKQYHPSLPSFHYHNACHCPVLLTG